jgi:hypothetical protein
MAQRPLKGAGSLAAQAGTVALSKNRACAIAALTVER